MSAKEEKDAASIRERTQQAWKDHPKSEVHDDHLPGLTSSGGEPANDAEIHAVDGYVFVNTHGEKRLDREEILVWLKRLEQAHQVVA